MKWLYSALDRLIYWGGLLAGVFILLTTGMIFYDVVARSLFNAPTTWATELSIYAILGSCFLGAAYALRQDGHIRVDLVLHQVSPGIRRMLYIVSNILGLIFSILFTWFGWEHVVQTMQIGMTSSSLLRIPMYIPQALLPVGGLLLTIAFILGAVDQVKGRES